MDTRRENREIFETMPDAFWAGDIPSTHKNWQVPAIVAAIAIPVLTAGLFLFTRPRVNQDIVAEVSYHVDNGVKGDILLADGTSVSLNSGSSLKVLDRRRVFLNGEGWFEVESDQEHPFYVETPSGISVRVTGTKFNLSNYKDEDFKVLLVKGNIELRSAPNSAPLVVKPSEQVTVRRGMASKEFANLQEKQNVTAWREGVLIFDDKPLREAIPMLERWYGVSISVNSPALYEERLTGEFDTETIQDVLKVLAVTHGFEYTVDHKDITIALR